MAKPRINCPYCDGEIELNVKAEGIIPKDAKHFVCKCGWRGPSWKLKKGAPPTCPECGEILALDAERTGIIKR